MAAKQTRKAKDTRVAITRDISIMDIATLAVVGASGMAVFYGALGDQQALEVRVADGEEERVEIREDLRRLDDRAEKDRKEILDAIQDNRLEFTEALRRNEDKLDRLIERKLDDRE